MLLSLSLLVLAYLLGSVSGSLLLGRWRGVDVRRHGSGSAGGTNAFRAMGWRVALGVVLIDIGKGVLAVWLAWGFVPLAGPLAPLALAHVAVLAAVAGHTWPLWHGFRGGKGAATLLGGLAVVWPTALPVVLLVWLLCLGLSGYVGLATMLAVSTLVPLGVVIGVEPMRLGFALAALAFIVFNHRDNIQRMRQGSENRFERARVLHRLLRRDRG
jgi:acyl phosphate:glycerol-3-phosphate acyltransferase